VVEIPKQDQIDVNHQDNAGRTALMLAIEQRNDEVSMALLNRKDINLIIGNVQEQSAVDYALKSGKLKDIGRYQKKVSRPYSMMCASSASARGCSREVT
jgi:ankyrin repeat protein